MNLPFKPLSGLDADQGLKPIKMKQKILSIVFLGGFLLTPLAHADSTADLSLVPGSIKSKDYVLEEKPVRLYATVKNNSKQDLLGTVKFYDETKGEFIGQDQPVSIVAGGTDDVFIDWNPGATGTKKLTARILPWSDEGDDASNNKISTSIFVDIDTDGDGIPNQKDPDDDNDEVKDAEDAFPLDANESEDSDGDGIGNNQDEDDDGDSVVDIQDLFPTDPKESSDKDGDGMGDGIDKFPDDPTESVDADGDGIGGNADINDQNKGPIPEIKITPDKALVGEIVTFDASGSNDPDGTVAGYEWKIDGIETEKVEKMEKTFKEAGLHEINLTVTDDKGESREAKMTLKLVQGWKIPVLIGGGGLILILLLSFLILSRKKHKKPLSEKGK